jgi:hypothetical protein
VSSYLIVACRIILIVVPGYCICCLVIVWYGGVAYCIVIVVPGYWYGGGLVFLILVLRGEGRKPCSDLAWLCLILCFFVLWLTGVAKGENLVLTCLCFALFLLFDGLVLLDVGYFIAIVMAWCFVVPGYCIGGIVIVVCCDCIGFVYGSPLWLYCLGSLFYLSEKRDNETPREYVLSRDNEKAN